MTQELVEHAVTCPYCWETLDVLIDPGDAGQDYIEDCQVCCQPIVFRVGGRNGYFEVQVDRDGE